MITANKQQNHVRRHVGLVLALVGLISATPVILEPAMVASAQGVAPSWSDTGSLNTARPGHSATLLPDGKVLVVGGDVGGCPAAGVLASAELYDPSTGTWSFTGSLNVPRVGHTATLLGNGKVLVAGGYANNICQLADLTNTAELYDPATGEWSFTGNLNDPRADHSAMLLSNGKALICLGVASFFAANNAELYDPDTGKWSLTGKLSGARVYAAATLLQDGKVLVSGGCGDPECFSILGSAELYDPTSETWSITGSLNTPRYFNHQTLTTLPNGNVLLLGGFGPFSLNTAELYNPATGRWSYTGSFRNKLSVRTVTMLSSGQVLVVGRSGGGSVQSGTRAELYNPASGKWNTTASPNSPSSLAGSATLLSDGKVLVVGLIAELYHPGVLDPAPTAPRIIMASVSGRKLFITGENFHDGAVILLNGEEQKTKNDAQNPQTKLIRKKAGTKVKPGDKLQVNNPDGSISEEFTYTGS